MTVLDAHALMAYLRDEPARVEVEALLRSGAWISAVNVVEVIDQMVRRWGNSADDIEAGLALLHESGALAVVPCDRPEATRAGRLRAVHYHRERRPVSLADCVAAATAAFLHRPLATADRALVGMAREEGLEVIALPDSKGHRS